jgi:hypothetical protein
MRSTAHGFATFLVAAAGALLVACPTPPAPTPSPTATPTPIAEYPKERWGMIVLYEKDGACTPLAGPPSIGAYAGEQITWRVYNNCEKDAKVEITDLRLAPSDRDGFTYAKTWDQIREVKRKRKDDKVHVPLDPFETVDKTKNVPGRGKGKPGATPFPAIDEFSLKVKEKGSVRPGLYTCVLKVNGIEDEVDIPIWP